MKLGIRNKWCSPRRWAWWTVLPVFLVLAATARAGDLPDPRIGPSEGTGAPGSEAVGASDTAGVPPAVRGADHGPEAAVGGAEPAIPPATGHDTAPGTQPVGFPTPATGSASVGDADRGARLGDRLRPSLNRSGATTRASDARTMVASRAAETIGSTIKALRASAFAAIDYLRAQLAGMIRRIDPPLPSTPHEHESPAETVRAWTAASGTAASEPAGAIKLTRGELSPPSGGTRQAPEASLDQLGTRGMTAGAKPSQSEHPVSSSGNPGPASGLGSTIQILIPLGLAAAVCGFAAPAMGRRLVPRAGWLKSALLASSLEQPG
jgi:hypothetical protein